MVGPRARRPLIAMLIAGLLAGCASAPPPRTELAAADAALSQARSLQADALAPVELGFAENKRAEAEAAFADRNYARAQVLANQATVDAELASAKSRAAAARAEVNRKTADNAKLRRELLGEGGAQ